MRSSWRVACVRVPRFALGALWEDAAGRRGAAGCDALRLALVRDGRVLDATPAARAAGVRAGAPAPSSAGVELVPWDATVVESAVTRGTARLLAASPQVTPVAGAPGMWWAAVGGADGAGGGERGVARALLRAAVGAHPAARVAVAGSCVAARAAVWGDPPGDRATVPAAALPDGLRLVPRGGCAAALAGAPIGFVPMDPLLRHALLGAGLRTAGALAALAPAEVARRWGGPGLAAWRLARGEDPRRPVLAGDDARRAASAELATPAVTVAPLLPLVRAALERLAARLAGEGRLFAAVAVTLTLDDGRGAHPAGGLAHTVTRELRLPCPLAAAAPVYLRCRTLLERAPLAAPVCGVRLDVTATAPAPAPAPHPGWVEALVSRV